MKTIIITIFYIICFLIFFSICAAIINGLRKIGEEIKRIADCLSDVKKALDDENEMENK